VNEALVAQLIRVLETSAAPIDTDQWPELADPIVIAELGRRLRRAGRQLITLTRTDPGGVAVPAYLSGYDDALSAALRSESEQQLSPRDTAVLTLVLLHSVVIPRARGRLPAGRWIPGIPVEETALFTNRNFGKDEIRESLKQLKAAHLLDKGNRPGPAWWRLTPAGAAQIAEALVLACRPTSLLAEEIRRRASSPDAARERP
jgi:hypothetical protein